MKTLVFCLSLFLAVSLANPLQATSSSSCVKSVLKAKISSVLKWLNSVRLRATRPHQNLENWFWQMAQSNEGIGFRRFFGNNPPHTPQSLVASLSSGVLYWHVQLVLVDSLEAAKAHAIEKSKIAQSKDKAKVNTPIYRPLYVVVPRELANKFVQIAKLRKDIAFLETQKKNPQAPHPREIQFLQDALEAERQKIAATINQNTLRNAIQNNGIYFDDSPKGAGAGVIDFKQIDRYEANTHLLPSLQNMEELTPFYADDNGNGLVLQLNGWTVPKERGYIDIKRTQSGNTTSAYKRGLKLWEKLSTPTEQGGLGLTLKESQQEIDIDAVLSALAKQERVGQEELGNRYLDPLQIQLVREAHKQGRVRTLEIYDADGKLFAGGLAFVLNGKLLSIDTFFYPPLKKKANSDSRTLLESQSGADINKMAYALWIKRLGDEGATHIDVQSFSSTTNQFDPIGVSDKEHLRIVEESAP